MFYPCLGFILGFCIPYLARRFAKIMLQTPTMSYALYHIFKINKQVSKEKRLACRKYITLRNHYLMRSFGWAITSAAILTLATINISPTERPWIATFILILLILMEIDKRIQYLPDILTSPLLIIGFNYAVFSGNLLGEDTITAVENSSLGSVFGYFVPVIASLLLVSKHPDNFGGGDIKILAAIGAWLGLANISFIILLACIFFAISFFITKKRTDAFGPSIVIASLSVLFYLLY